MHDYQAPADLLKDRIVMVTGAGSGIGRAAAKAYAAHGATVVLVGRTVSKLETIYDEIEAAGHPKPAIVPMNFEGAAVKDYEELAMTLEDNFGQLDGLLHNAAILGDRSPVEIADFHGGEGCSGTGGNRGYQSVDGGGCWAAHECAAQGGVDAPCLEARTVSGVAGAFCGPCAAQSGAGGLAGGI